MMGRRIFLATVAGLLAAPLAADAQQAGKIPQVGILSPLSAAAVASPPFEAFRMGLRDLGYVEGQNIRFVYRWAGGNPERLGSLAAELVSLKMDVIFSAPGTPTVIAAKTATATIPIIFVGAGDAVGAGIVKSLAHPGDNATGLVNQSEDIAGKQLELLKEAIPKLSRVGVLWRATNPSYKNLLRRFDDVVRATGVQVVLIPAESREQLGPAFDMMKKGHLQGLIVQADDLHIREGKYIVELAATYRMPTIYRLGEHAAAGGLMAYGPNVPEMYRRAAAYVDKILRGAKPDELPVQQPTKFDLVINLKTAKALGLTIPQSLLLRADEVIQR